MSYTDKQKNPVEAYHFHGISIVRQNTLENQKSSYLFVLVKLTGIEPDTPKTQHITHPRTFFLEIRVTLRGFTTQHWRKYTLKNRIVFDSRQLKSVLAPCFFIASCFILYARAFSLGNIFSRLRLQSTKFITASSFEKFFT